MIATKEGFEDIVENLKSAGAFIDQDKISCDTFPDDGVPEVEETIRKIDAGFK
jgi:hypothetical protein